MRPIRVTVPASTANLGPGFDCLGLALELRNELLLEPAPSGLQIEIQGEGETTLPRDQKNLVVRAAETIFERTDRKPSGLRLRARNRIPLDAGLGSSAAAVVGGLLAANALIEGNLTPHDLLPMAQSFEGHADNAAASLFGALNLVTTTREGTLSRLVVLPPMRVAAALPDFGLATREMRAALPQNVSLEDAVFNLGRALMTVEALRAGDYDLLARVMEDRLHQPYRAPRVRGFDAVRAAALEAGAAAVALSGAGPTLVAFAPSHHQRIADAMVKAWEQNGTRARAFVLEVAERGAAFD